MLDTHTRLGQLQDSLLHTDSFEDVEAAKSSCNEHAWYLRVPVEFFDLLLSLVDEQELWRDAFRYIGGTSGILLYSQVPLNYL